MHKVLAHQNYTVKQNIQEDLFMTPPDYLKVDGIEYHLKIEKIQSGYQLSYDGLDFDVEGETEVEAEEKMVLYLKGKGLV